MKRGRDWGYSISLENSKFKKRKFITKPEWKSKRDVIESRLKKKKEIMMTNDESAQKNENPNNIESEKHVNSYSC